MNKLNEINEQLSKHPYMINFELSLVEDFESEPYWVLCLVLSDNRSLLGNRIQIKLIDIRQLSTKSPNVGMCSVYQLCDVKDRQMEHIRYWFEDIEERMISCYCNSFEVTSLN